MHRRALLAGFCAVSLAPAALAATAPLVKPFTAPVIGHPIAKTKAPVKIGVIGSGNVGGTLGEVWSRAGHQVMFSDRDPAASKARAEAIPGARSGTVEQAIAFADVVLIAVPFVALKDVARDHGAALKGKIVFETNNPSAPRDGDALAAEALKMGSGLYVARLFPGVKLVRGFNTFGAPQMGSEANRPGEKVGIAVAADDPKALAMGVKLIRDAGFDPVPTGGLATASKFELFGPASGVHTAAELRKIIGLPAA